jgi:hypothetical protein
MLHKAVRSTGAAVCMSFAAATRGGHKHHRLWPGAAGLWRALCTAEQLIRLMKQPLLRKRVVVFVCW